MDSLRGHYADLDDPLGRPASEDEHTGHEPLPLAVGQAERRLQVRAYNFWAALLGDRQFPTIDTLDPHHLPDFAGFSALLDVRESADDPILRHIGTALAQECGASDPLIKLSDAPYRSLLSRIADHYRQIFASQAPVGFEAEFVNWRGATILYRGILLPFSRDDAAIDHVLCVINWKEVLDARVATALQREIAETYEPLRRLRIEPEGLTDWANGPGDDTQVPSVAGDLAIEAELPCDPHSLRRTLRALPEVPLAALPVQGEEFVLLLARRGPDGQVRVLGEVPHDVALVERAGNRLAGL